MFSVYLTAQAGRQDRTGLTVTYRLKRDGRAARSVFFKEEVIMNNHTIIQNKPCAPSGADRSDELTKTSTYMINGRRCIIEPVFKNREQTPETVGSILLKLMLEKA